MAKPRADDILSALLDLPEAERRTRLVEACGSDEALRAEVSSLLDAFESDATFLTPPIPAARPLPATLGRYRIRGELGVGSTGAVYLAEDPHLGRLIAIKVLTLIAHRDVLASRIRDEARALASITQPNVAAVYSIEEADVGSPGQATAELFLTMEYVSGPTLRELLRSGALPLETTLDYGRQIAAGLEAAHGRGIVHRDLTPSNIRTTPDGWLKLLDFGLASPVVASMGASPPRGSIEGTPGYLSPEQSIGAPARLASDLWALGCILFECLTGRPAFTGRSLEEVLAVTRSAAPDWDLLPMTTPPRLRELLRACLEKEPTDRPTSATDARRILEEELLRWRARRFVSTEADPSEAAMAGNIPVTWSSFIGREPLVQMLDPLVGDQRLVTLTGPGGVGKTRTAIEVATRVRTQFPGGAWFVDLMEASGAAPIAALVARAMNLHEVRAHAREDQLEETVATALAPLRVLLVLDNCEHVLEPAGSFCLRLLERCPDVHVVATSRAPLGVLGEQVVSIPPLELPRADDDAERRSARHSVRLFESRARLRDPSMSFGEAHLVLVSEMCGALDGLPLAIELAAGHVRTLPLEEIHRRVVQGAALSDRTNLRTPRHRTLDALVDWSHRLLTAEEQALFARLSVFRGGWTLATAEEVCAGGGLEAWQVCEAMSTLVEQSLVVLEAPAAGASARYRFLETVGAFASTRLAADARAREATETRYVGWYGRYARMLWHLPGREWVSFYELEYANLDHALEGAIGSRRFDAAFELGLSLAHYWRHTGYWSEGLARIRKLLAAWRDRSAPCVAEPNPADVASVLGRAAFLAASTGDAESSRLLTEDAVRYAREIGDALLIAQTLQRSGGAAWHRAELEEAEAYWREAIDLYRRVDDLVNLGACLGNLGALHFVRRDLAAADRYFLEHLEIGERTKNAHQVARARLNLGRSAVDQGRLEEGIARVRESLVVFREAKDVANIADAEHCLGDAAMALSLHDEAQRHFDEALRIRLDLRQESARLSVLSSVARLAERRGDRAAAIRLLEEIVRGYDGGVAHLGPEREKVERFLDELRGLSEPGERNA